jgi:uncharacterized protein YecE (DUF72 family)
VKAGGYLTHRLKLKVTALSLRRFYRAIDPLREKQGPILFQLPPRWTPNPERLDSFLKRLAKQCRYAVEFRDPRWHRDDVLSILDRHKVALCVADIGGVTAPCEVTADFAYVRLHGPGAAYRGRYGKNGLRPWLSRALAWASQGIDVYIYFDNDEQAFAIEDATLMKGLLALSEPPPSRRDVRAAMY